jgi:hypothetical protein
MTKPPDQPLDFLDTDAAQYMLRALRSVIPVYEQDTDAQKQARRDAAVAAVHAMQPRDLVEVMLAVQAITAQHTAADCYYRAKSPRVTVRQAQQHCRLADQLSRIATSTVRDMEKRQAKPVPVGRAWPPAQAEAPVTAPVQAAKPKLRLVTPTPQMHTAERDPKRGYLH